MTTLRRAAFCWFALAVVAGCASTEVADRERYEGAKLARPDRIIVHDFTANPAEVPPESAFAAELAGAATPTRSSSRSAASSARRSRRSWSRSCAAMGLPAVAAAGEPPPRADDIVLRGYFVSVDEGSARKRVMVGFGRGAAELRTAVEGFQMTPQGLRRLGRGEVKSGGGKVPGVVLPLAVVAATANPIGLVVGGAVKLTGEATGSATIEGAAKRTAKEIAAQIKTAAEEHGWI